MPKKRNSSGQLQNYVPAGNGDASGEYGDNASGSNIHYVAKGGEKPSQTNVGVSIEQTSDKVNYNGKDYTDQKEITDIIMKKMGVSKMNENVKRVVAQLNGENIDKDIRNVVLSTLESGNYKIQARKDGKGVYYGYDKRICFSSTDQLGRPTGETMFHECGHALDHQYADGKGLWSKDYVSKEFGKTMIQMKEEELKQALSNGGYEKLVAECNEFKSKYDEQINKIRDEIIEIDNEIEKLKQLPDDLQQKLEKLEADYSANWDAYLEQTVSWNEFREKRDNLSKEIENVKASNPNTSKIAQLTEKIEKLYDDKDKLQNEAHYGAFSKYSDISDMCEAMGYKAFAGGHGYDYWDDWSGTHSPTECFAEIQSALGTNKESLEVLQKYIPNTIKIYKEIIGEIHNGKK